MSFCLNILSLGLYVDTYNDVPMYKVFKLEDGWNIFIGNMVVQIFIDDSSATRTK